MVNERKREIVSRLAGAVTPVSGEELSRLLGISRVAVWKHIQALAEAGCPVESTRRGYILRDLPDTLEDWSFPGLSLPVHHYGECRSTMETARFLFRDTPAPFAVVAEHQSGGESHERKGWPSPPGGIYLTLVVTPRFPWQQSGNYNRLGAAAAAESIERFSGTVCRIEPPARVFLGDTLVAGIMTELYGPFDEPVAAALGIGIHVNGKGAPVKNLAGILGHDLSRREILADLLNRLTECLIKEY